MSNLEIKEINPVGINIFDVSRAVNANKHHDQSFMGDIGRNGEVQCHALDPITGRIDHLNNVQLARSTVVWNYFETQVDRVNDSPRLTFTYDGNRDALVYKDKQGKEHVATDISQMPSEIANLMKKIQSETTPITIPKDRI